MSWISLGPPDCGIAIPALHCLRLDFLYARNFNLIEGINFGVFSYMFLHISLTNTDGLAVIYRLNDKDGIRNLVKSKGNSPLTLYRGRFLNTSLYSKENRQKLRQYLEL